MYLLCLALLQPVPVWYVMEEFGSRIPHSPNPTIGIRPFFNIPTQMSHSVFWPLRDLDHGGKGTAVCTLSTLIVSLQMISVETVSQGLPGLSLKKLVLQFHGHPWTTCCSQTTCGRSLHQFRHLQCQKDLMRYYQTYCLNHL